MKNLLVIPVFILTTFFTSCDKIKDAADVDFNTTITGDIFVSINDPDNLYDDSVILSLSNDDTKDYLDKIESVEIKKLTYTLVNFTGDSAGKISGNLLADGIILHSVSDLNVANASSLVTVFEVTDPSLLNNAAAALLTNKVLFLQAKGSAVHSGSMSFIVRVKVDLKVKANAL